MERTFVMGTVKHIFIAPERSAPMVALTEVEAVRDCGLAGDRYARAEHRKSVDYQVTLIESENIDAFTRASGLPHEPMSGGTIRVGDTVSEDERD